MWYYSPPYLVQNNCFVEIRLSISAEGQITWTFTCNAQEYQRRLWIGQPHSDIIEITRGFNVSWNSTDDGNIMMTLILDKRSESYVFNKNNICIWQTVITSFYDEANKWVNLVGNSKKITDNVWAYEHYPTDMWWIKIELVAAEENNYVWSFSLQSYKNYDKN
jgi:hypothetical protein